MGSGQTRSRRGEKRNDSNKAGPSGGQQSYGSQFGSPGHSYGPGGVHLEPVAPLELSANRCTPASISRNAQPLGADTPEIVDRKVEYLYDIAIDAPRAHDFMAVMLKGAGMNKDEERHTQIASSKSDTLSKLLGLLSYIIA